MSHESEQAHFYLLQVQSLQANKYGIKAASSDDTGNCCSCIIFSDCTDRRGIVTHDDKVVAYADVVLKMDEGELAELESRL